jgi:tetratricopeptide (TPR) repeat protein
MNTGSTNIEDLNDRIANNSNDAEAYFHRARHLMSLDQNQKAVEDLSAALKIQPENDKLYYFRGVA